MCAVNIIVSLSFLDLIQVGMRASNWISKNVFEVILVYFWLPNPPYPITFILQFKRAGHQGRKY
jgi:hypothetical protein